MNVETRGENGGGARATAPGTEGKRVAMLAMHSSPLATLGVGKAGGMNVYVRELAGALGRRGVAVDVFTRAGRAGEPEVIELGAGARVVALPAGGFAPRDGERLLECVPEFVGRVCRFAGEGGLRYSVIHSHYWLSGAAALALRRAWRAPVVQMFHTLGRMKNRVSHDASTDEPPPRLRTEELLLREVDAVIAATPLDREQLRLYDGGAGAARRAAVIPCGIDARLFRPRDRAQARRALGLPPSPVRFILFVGRIEPVKGLDVLLRALSLVRLGGRSGTRGGSGLDVRLLVVGGSSSRAPEEALAAEERRLRLLAREVGVEDGVCFLGAQPHALLPLLYGAANAVVVPSRYESFGLVALEAQACGVPVIASRVGGLTYTVRDGASGCLAPPDDAPAFARRIERLMRDENLCAEMGARGRLVAQSYTWSRVADSVLALYREVERGAPGEAAAARAAAPFDPPAAQAAGGV